MWDCTSICTQEWRANGVDIQQRGWDTIICGNTKMNSTAKICALKKKRFIMGTWLAGKLKYRTHFHLIVKVDKYGKNLKDTNIFCWVCFGGICNFFALPNWGMNSVFERLKRLTKAHVYHLLTRCAPIWSVRYGKKKNKNTWKSSYCNSINMQKGKL